MEYYLYNYQIFAVLFIIILWNIINNLLNKKLLLKKIEIIPGELEIVNIVCRRYGILAWIFEKLNIGTVYSLNADQNRIQLIKRNVLNGESTLFIPLKHISSSYCRNSKRLFYLIIGILFLIVGLYIHALRFLLNHFIFVQSSVIIFIGLLFIVQYKIRKYVVLSFDSSGTKKIKMIFTKRLFKTSAVNLEEVVDSFKLINQNIISNKP